MLSQVYNEFQNQEQIDEAAEGSLQNTEFEDEVNFDEDDAENVRKLNLQEVSLKKFESYERGRAAFANYTSRVVDKEASKGLLADSNNFRSKVEGRELCDLGCTVEEKYGPHTGWKLQLRSYFDAHEKEMEKRVENTESEEYQNNKL